MSPEHIENASADVDVGDEGPRRGEVILRGVALVATLAAAAAAVTFRTIPERSIAVQGGCLLAASLWVVALGWEAWRGPRAVRLRPLEWLPGLALFLLAFLLRARMLSYLPLPDRTGFEELQMGADGYQVLTTWILPLELRFTKALAALGLAWGGATLEALRLPFQLMGYARLVVLYLCLRGLGVSRWPSSFVTITASVSRWSVIASGVAYEDFSPGLVLLILLFCLIKTDLRHASASVWAAGAGVMAGVLMLENSSFRFAIVLAGAWLLWVVFADRHQHERDGLARWRPFGFFLITLLLVSAPMLLDVAQRGKASDFFEAVTRYAKERPTALAPGAWDHIHRSLAVLSGWPVKKGSLLARELDRAVNPLVGAMFALAALVGLVRPSKPFVRAIVVAALAAVVACSVLTNDVQITRLAPVASLMFLPLGVFIESVDNGVKRVARRCGWDAALSRAAGARRGNRAGVTRTAVTAVVYGALSLYVVDASAARIGRMAGDRAVWREYANDQYVTALYLATRARAGMRVLVVTPERERLWSPDSIAYWVYAGKRLEVEGAQQLPPGEAIDRETMVVLGAEGRALRAEEIGELRALAEETGSLTTFDLYRGRGNRILVASICVGCGGSVSSSGAR